MGFDIVKALTSMVERGCSDPERTPRRRSPFHQIADQHSSPSAKRRLQAGALFALACVVSLAAAPARAGLPVTSRYAPGDQIRNVYFDPSVPTGNFRTRIANAAETWRKLGGVEQFVVHAEPNKAFSPDPCQLKEGAPILAGGISRGPIAGSTLAENRSCVNTATGQLVAFRQTYSTNKKFYLGSGDPPKKKYDLQGVATHEFGHAEGWTGDHYSNRNNSKLCANKAKQATMCPVTFLGTSRQRTLAKDDKNAVLAAYSEPATPAATLEALGLQVPAAHASAVAPGGAGARGCLAGLIRRIRLRRGGDDFVGGPGRQLVDLASGPDIGLGGAGDDCIVGGFGSDDLRAGSGNDTVIAGPGNDIIVGDPGNDLILGGRGADQIYAADGFFDRIRCGRDFDRVYTGDPNDVLIDCEMAPSNFTAIPLPPSYER